ncbi:hypothetical protein [Flavobacterium hydrophilum]|uniref:Beta-lactamase-inhibitor-like PepSY-like domain-containing protein n=1 Tax=Flavobacterium hydrophilum TaxID=2211445 RepID=A0A2V4C0C3_9FLAO|nr:hypothetical protein [Flavobacterium hydrophilum]PXY44746.1 hypothetical protein DMB68_14935 [Flavobacterium hydrophilum]
MKKLILSAAIILGSLSIYASTVNDVQPVKTTLSFQSEYTEISNDQVPAAVKTALEAAYPGAVLEKAYVNDQTQYKLDIAVGDQKATVYSDANGNWLKI